MKKKIINGIMMVALVAATSTSFVSCKDTNEDVRVEQAIEIAGLQGRLSTLENQYGDLDGRISAMKTRLDDVQDLAESNRDDIDVLQLNVDAMEEEIDQLELWLVETFAKLVTNVEISGTYNNMTGSINIPGFEPKMLIFNYGVASKKGTFPKTVNVEAPLEWEANEQIGAGKYNSGFAGFIYANINRYLDLPLLASWQWDLKGDEPTGPAFDFALVNTAGEEADGLIIGNMDPDGAPTTDVLEWGWTRAENNIYKLGVVYNGDEASNFTPAKVDLSLLKNDIKAVWNKRKTDESKQTVGRLAADLYYNYATKDTNMKKYALKVSWADGTAKFDEEGKVTETEGTKHMQTSEAELVFAAIKPLAFTSGDALADAVNGKVQSANNLIEKLEPRINSIVERVQAQLNLQQYHINTLPFTRIEKNASGRYIVKIAKNTYIQLIDPGTGLPQNYKVNKDIEIDINDIVGPIKEACDNMNKMIDNFDDFLNPNKNNYGKKVTGYLEKVTNKISTVFENNGEQLLQPVLLAINNDVVNRVSGIKEMPYIAAGEVTLKPTTYTAELFAPCYAKFVGCKDIDEDNFNQILFSGDQELKFTPKAGKLYEIVYEAVDYFGNTVEQHYYILGGVK